MYTLYSEFQEAPTLDEGTKRAYLSPKRSAASEGKRAAVLNAAAVLLNQRENVTMEAVATAAGVARLTVYNQFGSRRGLLEAVFDDHARRGGVKELAAVITAEDPVDGLDRMIDILCQFWGAHPVIGALQDAAVADPDLKLALDSRQARRREIINLLLKRINAGGADLTEAEDMLYAMISLNMFRALHDGRQSQQVAHMLKRMSRALLNVEGLSAL